MTTLIFLLLLGSFAQADEAAKVLSECENKILSKFNGVGIEPKRKAKSCLNSKKSSINESFKMTIGERTIVGACQYTYEYIEDQVIQLQNGGKASCAEIAATAKEMEGSVLFNKDALRLRFSAEANLSKFEQQLAAAGKKSEDIRKNSLEVAGKEILALQEAGQTAQANELKAIWDQSKASKSIGSRKETDDLNNKILKRSDISITGPAVEQLVAVNEAQRLRSIIEEQEKEVALAKTQLNLPPPGQTPDPKGKGDLDSLNGGSPLGSAISGILPFAPLAVPLVSAMMNQKKSGVGSNSFTPPAAPKGPEQISGSKLSSPDTNLKGTEFSHEPSEKPSLEGGSKLPELHSGNGTDNSKPLLSDVGKGENQNIPTSIQGSLGKGQDIGLGKGMDSSSGASNEEGEAPPAATAGSDPSALGDGSIPPRSTASVPGSKFGDLLKQLEEPSGSKNAPGNEPAIAGTMGDDLLKQMEALELPKEGVNSADSQTQSTSLFSRVRATHLRFIKRGGVTSEAGGKVL